MRPLVVSVLVCDEPRSDLAAIEVGPQGGGGCLKFL